MVWLPGTVSDALRIDLSQSQRGALIPFGPVDGDLGRFQTVRECGVDQADGGVRDEGAATRGRWLRQAVSALRSPEGEAAVVPWVGDGVVSPEVAELAEAPAATPTPHLSIVARLGRMDGQDLRQLTLDARWRLGADVTVSPPGQRWQLRLEWCHPADGWVSAMLGGVPVDDLHQGMRSRRVEGPGGDELRLRWSVPEPRRWKGRKIRLRVGSALGGPLVSAPVTVG
jgi:hypothetical protein